MIMVDFNENIDELKNAYFGTEHQFIEVSRVISVDNDPSTFSPRLYSILGDACSQVENLLRLLCDKLEIPYNNNEKNFPSYYKKLNETEMLQRQQISLLIGKKVCLPFVIPKDGEPTTWWTAYNKTKHDLPQGYKQGNLGNTILALAGAYSLHCISAYVREYGRNVLKNEWWQELDSTALNTQSEFPVVEDLSTDAFIMKSKIFYCLSFYQDLSMGL